MIGLNKNNYTEEDLIPLSAIQHFAFCERQWGLIHLEQQWQENQRTAEGQILHEKVHNPEYKEYRDGVVYARSLPLKSYQLGLWGIADMVEFHPLAPDSEGNGARLPGRAGYYRPVPVEYKRGRPKKDDRDVVQLCAQAICLEEMTGAAVEKGFLYYGQTRHRVEITFDEKICSRVIDLSRRMHMAYNAGLTPAAGKGVRCSLCSMQDVCLPELTRQYRPVQDYIEQQPVDDISISWKEKS